MVDPLVIVGVTIVLGVVAAVAVLRVNRRKSYQRWPQPVRVVWYGLVAALVMLGAAALLYNWSVRWGVPAAVWLLLAPLAYGLWRGRSIAGSQRQEPEIPARH